MSTTIYIAETDGDGFIEHVWVARPKDIPRPFDPHRDRLDPKANVQYSGARPAVIMSWIAARQNAQTGLSTDT